MKTFPKIRGEYHEATTWKLVWKLVDVPILRRIPATTRNYEPNLSRFAVIPYDVALFHFLSRFICEWPWLCGQRGLRHRPA